MSALKVLITGGRGFIGSSIASYYKNLDKNNQVYGVGHSISKNEAYLCSYDQWLEGDVNEVNLMKIEGPIDLIIHCAGVGSVGYAEENPKISFEKSVNSTIETLEFTRKKHPEAYFIYPSSSSVYGNNSGVGAIEGEDLDPISIYGVHKKMCEDLVKKYSEIFKINAGIVRYYSVYGPGLRKQLIWDAIKRISESENNRAIFWGTGDETRDWIYIDDAVELLDVVYRLKRKFIVVNGGSGNSISIKETLEYLRKCLHSNTEITFNGESRPGDPIHYKADMSHLFSMSKWRPKINIENGLSLYKNWYFENNK
jgi:UDP-glucose 4-epimerase